MEYRKLPHGPEALSAIGLGLGNIYTSGEEEIERTIAYAIDHQINFFDMCGGNLGVYRAFGRASAGRRNRIYTQMHFGAVYEQEAYGFSRKLDLIQSSFEKVLKACGTDYTDFGYIHCIDEDADFDSVMNDGLYDYVRSLKAQGIVRHIGFSTHTPSIARRFLEIGDVDLFMFSLNPAYDFAKGAYAYGSIDDRATLYAEAQRLGVGITVMKPFAGGQLLDEKRSPLGIALNRHQCIQYALDRPAVLSVLPGVSNVEDVKSVLTFYDSTAQERDYSQISKIVPADGENRCVYCNHCAPCPRGIDIGLVNKYYDLAKNGDEMARGHYENLSVQADACVQCGHCEKRCPFHVDQMRRMREIREYFGQ